MQLPRISVLLVFLVVLILACGVVSSATAFDFDEINSGGDRALAMPGPKIFQSQSTSHGRVTPIADFTVPPRVAPVVMPPTPAPPRLAPVVTPAPVPGPTPPPKPAPTRPRVVLPVKPRTKKRSIDDDKAMPSEAV